MTPEDEREILKATHVVRFNNYATRAGIVKTQDPLRCDILFTTYDLHSQKATPSHVVIGIPFPFKAKSIIYKMDKWYPDSNHWMVNPYMNMVMCEEFGIESEGYAHPIPSIGCTALWHLSKLKCDIYVGGFNWYHLKDDIFQGRSLTDKAKRNYLNHDYHQEIRYMAELRKIILIFLIHATSFLI